MAFRVARMARVKSGAFKARKAIPADVWDAYAALYGVRREALFRAAPGCTPQRAKAEHMAWLEELEMRIETLRAKQRGEGHDLTQRQAHALAGEWYRWFIGQYEDAARSYCTRHEGEGDRRLQGPAGYDRYPRCTK
jgi:hypothetical protein